MEKKFSIGFCILRIILFICSSIGLIITLLIFVPYKNEKDQYEYYEANVIEYSMAGIVKKYFLQPQMYAIKADVTFVHDDVLYEKTEIVIITLEDLDDLVIYYVWNLETDEYVDIASNTNLSIIKKETYLAYSIIVICILVGLFAISGFGIQNKMFKKEVKKEIKTFEDYDNSDIFENYMSKK